MADIEKLELTSTDILDEQRQKLKELFPEIFSEGGKIDFERLKLTLGEMVDPGKERYGMNWPGKADCFKIIQQPSIATLTPDRGESVDFDTTENLFIEGDNLEVLKLLQKSYFGKIKMIEIDPPYNTGNDFIYPDNYSESLDTYLRYTGQIDDEGRKYSTNTEADGRFHSKWMNMMYPRLFLARNLLREDGVIFIHIDDHEVDNLKKICDEIFGEENHIASLTAINNMKGRNDKANVATCHEYLLIYSRGNFVSYGLPLTEEQLKEYKYEDENGEKFALRDLRKRGRPDRRIDRPNMFFPIFFNQKLNSSSLDRLNDNDVEILPKRGDGSDGRWRWGTDRVSYNLKYLHPRYSEKKERWDIDHRVYLKPGIMSDLGDEEADDGDQDFVRTSKTKSFWWGGDISTDVANREFKRLFNDINPDYPKSPFFIEKILNLATKTDDIILDFFSGYSTTAHAALDLNKEDGGNRKFIMVQLPEPTEENSEAHKAGYKTIADIGKERIRRVIKRIKEEQEKKKTDLFSGDRRPQDLGFKVFKLQPSNFKLWKGEVAKDKETIERQLALFVEHINPKSSQEDILYEILLKSGFPLTTKIEKIVLAEKSVFSISDGSMFICLEKELSPEVIKAMAERKPVRVVCLDEGFKGNDQLKTNAVQIMKTRNITFRTV
jgi:adenine-specific DNA-methyltransferase